MIDVAAFDRAAGVIGWWMLALGILANIGVSVFWWLRGKP